jgi:hypothetical protein
MMEELSLMIKELRILMIEKKIKTIKHLSDILKIEQDSIYYLLREDIIDKGTKRKDKLQNIITNLKKL